MTPEGNGSRADELHLYARLSLLLIAPLSGLAQAGLSPVLPKISEQFAGEPQADVLVRLLVSSVPAAMIFGSIAGGFLAERYGQRRTLLWSLAAYAVAGSAGFLLPDLMSILVSRILLGIFISAAGVITAAIITTRIPQIQRNKWLGFFMMAGTFGAIAILLVSGALGAYDWRLVFLMHAVALPVMLLIALLLPPDSAPARSERSSAKGRFPFALTLYGIAVGSLTSASVIFLPYHLAEIGEADPQRVASAILPTAITGGLGAFAFGWLHKHLGTVNVFVLAFAFAGAGALLIVWTGTYTGALIGISLVGTAVGIAGPNLFAASADAAPPEFRARTIGIVRAGSYAGPIVVQLAFEPISLTYGAGSTLTALGVFAVVMIGLTLAARRMFVPAA